MNKFLFALIVIASPILATAQCVKMQELVDMYDNNYSFDYSSYSNIGYQNSLSLDGLPFTYSIQGYTTSGGDRLLLRSSELLILTTNANCYTKIKAAVAKQAGSLVGTKTLSSTNGYSIEHYDHLTQDMIIEFHKLESESQYNIVLMSSSMSQNIKSLIDKKIRQQNDEKYLKSKLEEVKLYIASNELNKAEYNLKEAKNYSERTDISSMFSSEIQNLENQIVSLKFKLFNIDFLGYLNSNNFVAAKNLIDRFPNTTDPYFKKQLSQMKSDLKAKAVGYYTSKSSSEKSLRNYSLAITYLDSLLLFDYENKMAVAERSELVSINSFLKERKTKVFNYWETNNYVKENIFKDYRSKCYSLVNEEDGHVAFNLNINTDTNCTMSPRIDWLSSPTDRIFFTDNEINKYSAKPYQKFGYCANSSGSLSFDINWSSTHYKLFWVNASVSKNTGSVTKLDDYLAQRYPLINGRFNYSRSSVNFNGESTEKIQITDFKTRGPINAFFSLIVPGTGTLIVSYGKKGYEPLGLYLAGAACILVGNTYGMLITGVVCVVSSYIWDFSSALFIGSRNVIRAKEVRKALRSGTISL